MSAVAPLTNILSGATRNALTSIGKLQGPAQVLPKSGLNEFFQNLFKTAPNVAIPTATKIGTGTIKSVLSKTNVITTGIFGTTALLSLTQGGQNLVTTTGESAKNISQFGSSVTDFFNKNPLVPLGLLVLGGLVVVSVIKK